MNKLRLVGHFIPFDSIDKIIEYVLEQGIDPSIEIEELSTSGEWIILGPVEDYLEG